MELPTETQLVPAEPRRALPPAVAGIGRLTAVKIVLALAMAAGLLLSPKLWHSARVYPLSPVVDWLPAAPPPPPMDSVVYGLLLAMLGVIALLPRPRGAILAFIAVAAVLCLQDQGRWQPWVYQYLLMLGALALPHWPRRPAVPPGPPAAAPSDGHAVAAPVPADADRLLNPCRVIIAFIYLYSGAQKCNASFFRDLAPWLLEPALKLLPDGLAAFITRYHAAIPVTEMLIGLGLLVPIVRPVAVVVAMLMHAFILFTLGPWGHNWNTVVWPWNLAMMALVPLLFLRTRHVRILTLLWGRPRDVYPKLVLVLVGVLPLLSFAGRWDLYLSAALYSGNTPMARLEFDEEVYAALPPAVQAECYRVSWDRYEVNLVNWAVAELNVPDYPADRVHLNVAREMSRRWPDRPMRLMMDGRPTVREGRREMMRIYFLGGKQQE